MSLVDLPRLVTPKFTDEQLIKILSNTFDLTDIKINKLDFGSDAKKGDSYLSTICRFTVEAVGKISTSKVQNVSLAIIVKYFPKNLGRRKTFRSLDFFRNETIFYENVWSTLRSFIISKKLPEDFVNIPRCLSTCDDGLNNYIALEDLSAKGYAGLGRETKLDVEHVRLILTEIAKFHAASLAFKAQKPEEFETIASSLQETYFAEKFREWYIAFQEHSLFAVGLDAVEKQLPALYSKKLKELFSKDFYGVLCEHCKVRSPFSVVTHGDTWIPNFLFKTDKNSTSVAIIDFQLARYTSLSTDLTFFLYACLPRDMCAENWDQFVTEYHRELMTAVEELGSDCEWLTLEALKAEVKRNAVFGVGMALEAKTMALLDDDNVADIDSINDDEGVPLESVWVVHPFKSKEKQEEIAAIFKHAFDNEFI